VPATTTPMITMTTIISMSVKPAAVRRRPALHRSLFDTLAAAPGTARCAYLSRFQLPISAL
jgi:hypothetical protein